jgi:DNA invertase Pin-like site-specific DNA recombinase
MKNPSSSFAHPQLETPKGELIGYARVSTEDQSLELQTRALKAAGCLNIYEEKLSGAKKHRPELDLAIKDLRPGDTLVVWRLDRLSRSIRDLHRRLGEIEEQGANLKSLTEHFDFTTAVGKLMLNMLAVMAEFERQLTIERTRAGMAVLREKGHRLGAVVKFDAAKKKAALKMLAQRERRSVRGKMLWRKRYTQKQVADALKISQQTLYLYLRERKQEAD